MGFEKLLINCHCLRPHIVTVGDDIVMTLRFCTAILLVLSFAAGTASAKQKHHIKASDVRASASLPPDRSDPHSLHVGGAFIGADPDPTIRAQLLRDFYTGLANW
jgi:hypothetical protein